ncbi:MAG: beta-ketoacyl-ACP reductase [Phycisphaerae bacterium]
MRELEGKVSLVTGGSRGIGRAITLALAKAGANVAVNYAGNHARAEETCELARAQGVRASRYQANVSKDEENHRMVEQVLSDYGKIDILVNNAGITRDKSFAKMTYEIWHEVIDVDLTGPAMVTHEVLKSMTTLGWGRIVFITSVIGQMGNFGQSNYSAAKGGLIALTKTLAREMARKGITVNAVAPGFIQTEILTGMPPEALDGVKAATPMGRLGQPEEVAEAVRFLCGPLASYITGEVLNVNGGMFMG